MAFTLALTKTFASSADDEANMEKYAKSAKQAYLSRLIESCGDDLYHYLLTLTDSETAKDVSQTTWIKVMNARTSYRVNAKFKTWLFTIARNALTDQLRKSGLIQLTEDTDDFIDQTISSEALLTSASEQALFDEGLESLSFVQREAILLQLDGFSVSEIADITGQAAETIKTRIRYAKNNLKLQLVKDHE